MTTKEEMQQILNSEVTLPAHAEKGSLEGAPEGSFEMSPQCVTFPTALDNTIISTFRACPHKAFRQYLQHLATTTTSIHLTAGGAFAAGLETARNSFYLGKKSAEASLLDGVRALLKEWGDADPAWDHTTKSLDKMVLAMVEALQVWPLGADWLEPFEYGARNGVEFSFAVELPVRHPVSDDPILYTGRIDLLGVMHGALFCEDDKTTAQLGPQWIKSWDLRSQFTGYAYAMRELGLPCAGTVVRGVSPQKYMTKTSEAVVYQPDWKIDRWLKQTVRDIEKMKQCWAEGWWDYNLGDTCNAFGGCVFKDLCNSPQPEAWIRSNFVRRVWDPLGVKMGGE